jgi:hypothetical protein
MTKKSHSPSAIFELGFKEPYLRAPEKPFIKLLNWYTGFGKTYTAAAFSIELLAKCDVIPIFVAPLQSLVTQFSTELAAQQARGEYADDVQAAIRELGHDIPVHRLYSIEYHKNDRLFFKASLALVDWLENHPAVVSKMETSIKSAQSDSSVRARLPELRSKAAYCEGSNFLGMSSSDDSFEETKAAYAKAAGRAYTIANSFTWRLITLDVSCRALGNKADRFMQAPAVAEMVRRLHPLQAFLDNPGVIVTTASKAQVKHKVYAADEDGEFKSLPFDNLPEFLRELNRDGSVLGRMVSKRPDSARVVTFVDEEEDAYWYLFDQRKSVVNSGGRNDLNLVISEFFQYFDLKWPRAFEVMQGRDYATGKKLALKVYQFLEHFAAVSQAMEDEFLLEKTRTGAQYISDERRVELFRAKLAESKAPQVVDAFENGELLTVLDQLHDRNDAHAGFKRFRQKARVLQRLRKYVETIIPKGGQAYEAFCDLHDLVVNKKFFTMSRATYGEVLDQPGQTFFTESANVMDTEFLRQVQLTKDTADQTIRLLYHDGEMPEGAFTLLSYLRLVVVMAQILSQRTGEDQIEMSEEDQELYKHLNQFRNDVRRLFDDQVTSTGLNEESSEKELLTDAFLFEGTKSVVTLEESRRQAEEYNLTADVSLTLTITSLKATPEEDIVTALGRNNGVYLMSATGGLEDASSGAFNVRHLRRSLEARGGYFSDMSQEELDVVAQRAAEYMAKRERVVTILEDDDPARRFGVSKAYNGLIDIFKDALPKKEEKEFTSLNSYKRAELEGLVASLDRLMATPMRSGLVLCQTTMHVRKCLVRLAGRTPFVIQKDRTGDLFEIRPQALPTYRGFGQSESITIALYSANRFRKKDRSKIGAVDESDDKEGQFNEELEEALDISNKKVLLWTAYSSASRGINFLTRNAKKVQDFELFCLLNDPYYTRHTRPGTSGFSMEMFQSFAQVLRDENEDWATMSKGDLLFEYARNRFKRLRKEHVIDITRTIFQAIGRGERRPDELMPTQRIFVSSEAARTVHLGLRHAPQLRKRASPAQRALLQQIEIHNREAAVFPSEEARQAHHKESLKRAIAFRVITSETPKRFHSDPEARALWDLLFDSQMFTDPVKYLAKLEQAGVPKTFRDGCYLEVPVTAELYCRQFSLGGYTEKVITDSEDGTESYNWIAMCLPEMLKDQLSATTRALLKDARGFKLKDCAKRIIPQPWFVTEVMKGYLTELEFEQYIGREFNVWARKLPLEKGAVEYLDLPSHPQYAELYQRFDYYITPRPDVVVAIDLKNWTRVTDSLKKEAQMETAEEKHAKLRELLPDTTVHALYVNLVGAQKLTMTTPPSGSIRFMSMFVPNTSTGNFMLNSNLRDAILAK